MGRQIAGAFALVVIGCGGADDAAAPDAAPPDAVGIGPVEAYVAAWSEPDAAIRARLLEHAAIAELTVHEPTRVLASRDAVDDAIAQFHQQVPGGTVPLVGGPREFDGHLWFYWDALDGAGTRIDHGADWMTLAPDGRVARVYSFFGDLPAPGAHDAVQQALLDAWNEPDATTRLADLDIAVSADVVVHVESLAAPLVGRAALSDHIAAELAEAPDRVVAASTGYLRVPGGWHRGWRVTVGGDPIAGAEGVVFARLAGGAATDPITELVLFDGTAP